MEHLHFSTLDLVLLTVATILSFTWLWLSELREWKGGRK